MIMKNNKFSIVVPVYNVEAYIDKCLKSIQNQLYKNYEVIVVNDGSPDDCQKIINEYVKKDKRFKSFIQKNKGLSEARNFGVSQTSGDILVFVDSDDYIDKDLLSTLNEEFNKYPKLDVVHFHLKLNTEEGIPYEIPNFKVFPPSEINSVNNMILSSIYADISMLYAYKLDFYKKNNFKFAKGRLCEDFGLTHHILTKAKYISSIPCIGYNYVQREESIMNSKKVEVIKKRVYDILFHFDNYIKILKINDYNTKHIELLKYMVNVLLYKSIELHKKDYNQYIKELKKRKLYKYYPNNTIKDKLRRVFIKYYLEIYIYKNYKRFRKGVKI